MSAVNGRTTDMLSRLATLQRQIADGQPVDLSVLEIAGITPAQIAEALNRDDINQAVPAVVDQTVGDAMTLGDEAGLLAALERATQSCYQTRLRRIVHHQGRARGHADPQGILLYGLQQMMARPE